MSKIFIIILLAAVGCKSNSGVVTLELKNDKIIYVNNEDTNLSYVYNDEIARENSANVIEVLLSNKTEKKLLFVFDRDVLYPSSKIVNDAYGHMGFQIKDKDSSVQALSKPMVSFDNSRSTCNSEMFMLNDSIKKVKYRKLGIDKKSIDYVDNLLNNSVVLYPGESHIFKFIVSLPIITEIDSKRGIAPVFYSKLDGDFRFQLFYSCNAKSLEDLLPAYYIEQLEKNQVEIFDGVLLSNNVKLSSVKK